MSLICFIWNELPNWRDDPTRPKRVGETLLTSQLCAYLNSTTRRSRGWDFLQFRVEEADEVVGGRKIDLIPAPSGTTIWIEGREYSQYSSLLPIECKRLPTPGGISRDEREYLFSAFSSTGGVQRFKAGHHGAAHAVGALIGYIQEQDLEYWIGKNRLWLDDLVEDGEPGWREGDALHLTSQDLNVGTAILKSQHCRSGGLSPVRLYHLWVVMGGEARKPQ